MGEILIITGGPICSSFAQKYIKGGNWDVIIAADRGLEFCNALHLEPNLILGDFDSADEGVVSFYEKKYPERFRRYPARKNQTDTELAIDEALLLPQKEIHILGALGGRTDHMLANIQLLKKTLSKNKICYLVDEGCRIRMTDKPVLIRRTEMAGSMISLIAYGENVAGLTLTGFAYETDNLTLVPASSRGISNYLIADDGMIRFTKGTLLIIESDDK